jgi:sialic acid synthase SpsE
LKQEWQIYCDVGSNHNGDLDRAKDIIRAVAKLNGVVGHHFKGVKFQLFHADKLWAESEYSPDPQVVKDRQFDPLWIQELLTVARQENITIGFTAFDDTALDILGDWIPSLFFKVSSFDLLRLPFLARNAEMARLSGRSLQVSTGGADIGEIEAALDCIADTCPGLDVILYHCVSEYPLSPFRARMQFMASLDILARKYVNKLQLQLGWSDHTRNPGVVCRSMSAYGAVAELHVDLDDGRGFESAHGHCWTISELRELAGTLKGFHDCISCSDWMPLPDLRADPDDGLRPLKKNRKKVCTQGGK